jgi:hypothetical protein
MTASPRSAARAAFLALALAATGAVAPLVAQQAQNLDNAASVSAQSAPAAEPATVQNDAPAANAAGPRVSTAMPRVDARFKNSSTTSVMQEGEVSHSYLVYILVVAVLVVLLIFLIKRA